CVRDGELDRLVNWFDVW
nr:immunoglobulin heavy chain junction region [Macaca mulatta]MPN69876.1 immunoglobulin heavy chain junction region [Macaca mulatta]MPN69932.1 immunoglobulin heavy chain junction region [Macaca mulatta]MPN70102.1 immunoglobulin heavy chain junction region [Macaca mulatta]MPN70117.1 immunoglobulin heavy chain junction region [Macaca mulatta]